MNILVTLPKGRIRRGFIPECVEKELAGLGDVYYNDSDSEFDISRLKAAIKDADVCITGWSTPRIDENVLSSAKRLALIAHTGGTVMPYVCDKVFERGIRILSGNEIYAQSVAEGALTYMLASLRGVVRYNKLVQSGGWRSELVENEGLFGRTIGLVGFGAVARHLVKLLDPFHVKIKVFADHLSSEDCARYHIEKATLEEVFSTCKVISLHNALTPQTKGMVDGRLLAMIPDGAVLINTARGAIIDERALEVELQKGRFKAVLDVFTEEPLPSDSGLRGLDNAILIPHMAGPTLDRWPTVTLELIEDIRRFYRGEKMLLEIKPEQVKYMTRPV